MGIELLGVALLKNKKFARGVCGIAASCGGGSGGGVTMPQVEAYVASLQGANNGLAPLNSTGTIDPIYLPASSGGTLETITSGTDSNITPNSIYLVDDTNSNTGVDGVRLSYNGSSGGVYAQSGGTITSYVAVGSQLQGRSQGIISLQTRQDDDTGSNMLLNPSGSAVIESYSLGGDYNTTSLTLDPSGAIFSTPVIGLPAVLGTQFVTKDQLDASAGGNLQSVTTGAGNNVTSNALQITGLGGYNPALEGLVIAASSGLGLIARTGTVGNSAIQIQPNGTMVFTIGNNIASGNSPFLTAIGTDEFGGKTVQIHSNLKIDDGIDPQDAVTMSQLATKVTIGGNTVAADLAVGTSNGTFGLTFKTGGTDRLTVSGTAGQYRILNAGSSSYGIIDFGTSGEGILFTRTRPDATPAASVVNGNTSSTGDIFQLRSNIGGTTAVRASFAKDGSISAPNLNIGDIHSSASTLTLSSGGYYSFEGTTATWTLPAVASSTKKRYVIMNLGSGALAVNTSAGASDIQDGASSVATLSLSAGENYTLYCNGNKFIILT